MPEGVRIHRCEFCQAEDCHELRYSVAGDLYVAAGQIEYVVDACTRCEFAAEELAERISTNIQEHFVTVNRPKTPKQKTPPAEGQPAAQ